MINLGLTAAQQRLFHAALAQSHEIRVKLTVLDLNENPISTVSNRLLDGQVNVNMDEEVTRSATLSILDPNRTLQFDTGNPADGALYFDRMMKVEYGVEVPGLGWVDVPVITGPVKKFDRTDQVANVEIQGKEMLAKSEVWRPITIKKGARITDAIETIMRQRAGEANFAIIDLPNKLVKDLSLSSRSVPWRVCLQLAAGVNRQLFYDGDGILQLRAWPLNTIMEFKSGQNSMILTPPQVSFNHDNFYNGVQVTGGIRKGITKTDNDPKTKAPTLAAATVTAYAQAAADHPLSPSRLARNGVPYYKIEFIDDTAIVDPAAAQSLAVARLRQRLLEELTVAFDALPAPHLEPGDILRIVTEDSAIAFKLRKFSIPLTSGGKMPLGYVTRTSARKERIRT